MTSPATPDAVRPRGPASITGRLLAVVVAGYAWGALTNALPASDDPAAFWLGNLCAPYVLLGFLAGAWVSGLAPAGRRHAIVAGALVTGAAIAGFYGFMTVGDVTNSQLDLPSTVTARAVVLESYRRWFSTFLLGVPGGIPWLTIGVVTGSLTGALGFEWRRRAAGWAAVLVASTLVLEAAACLAFATVLPFGPAFDLRPANVAAWATEAIAGIVVVAIVVRHGRGRQPWSPTA